MSLVTIDEKHRVLLDKDLRLKADRKLSVNLSDDKFSEIRLTRNSYGRTLGGQLASAISNRPANPTAGTPVHSHLKKLILVNKAKRLTKLIKPRRRARTIFRKIY